jgi:hypothetical protein
MTTQAQIDTYLASQPEPKRSELQALHELVLQVSPACQLWFSDGKNSDGKIVSNPNIGYGCYTIQYADGTSREFYQVGLSANTTGISVYIMGIKDKTYLAATFGDTIGKASVTGYCIKFKTLKHINLEILEAAIRLSIS